MKQFTYAGVSRLDGELKLRFANVEGRFLVLVKNGHTEVEMIKLTKPMDKNSAIKELLVRNFANGRAEIDALLLASVKDENPFVKITVPNQALVELVGAKVKVERGPFGKVFPEIKMTPKQAEQIRAEWNAKHKALA